MNEISEISLQGKGRYITTNILMVYYGILFLLGRILFGGYFLINGLMHFAKLGALADYARSREVSSPKIAVMVSGLLIILGGAGIILGVYVEWAVLCLILFLVPVSFIMHSFWKDADPGQKNTNRMNFMRNMAFLGAALLILAIPTPWVLALMY